MFEVSSRLVIDRSLSKIIRKLANSKFIGNHLLLFLGYLLPVKIVACYLRRYLVFDKGLGEEVVFILQRTAFDKDIQILREQTPLRFITLSRGYTVAQYLWFPHEMRQQTYFSTFIGRKYERAIRKSTKLFNLLLDHIEKTYTVSAVFSANFDYWQEAGLFAAAKDRNKLVLIISREHPVVPKAIKTVTNWYLETKFKFTQGKVVVAGPSTKNVLVQSGVCNSSQILEFGLPRFDPWTRLMSSTGFEKTRQNITLMSFADGYYANDTFRDVLNIFVEIAETLQGLDVNFIIKSKDEEDTRLIETLVSKSKQKFVEINHSVSLYKLLLNSRAVVGYNSLALVEAALAKSPIILPAWGQCREDGDDVMYPKSQFVTGGLVQYASSSLELKKILKDFSSSSVDFNPSEEQILNFVRRFISFEVESSSAYKIYSEFEKSLSR